MNTARVILTFAMLCGIGAVVHTAAIAQGSGPRTADLVLLHDDTARRQVAGCDKMTAYDMASRRILHGGAPEDTIVSFGRMTANRDLSVVLGINNKRKNYDAPPYLVRMSRMGASADQWETTALTGAPFMDLGDVLLLPDGDTFIVSTGDNYDQNRADGFSIRKYRLSDLKGSTVGSARGEVPLDLPAARILPSPDWKTVHVIEATPRDVRLRRNTVRSFSANTLEEVGEPIVIGPIAPYQVSMGFVHGSVSTDGRYLITNIWTDALDDTQDLPREVNVVDLSSRTSRRVVIGQNRADVPTIGGVSMNYAEKNRGLLALHAFDQIIVAAVTQHGDLQVRGRINIPPPPSDAGTRPIGSRRAPWMSIEWSGDGGTVIAASTSTAPEGDFILVNVNRDGRDLSPREFVDVCSAGSAPQEIVTSNRYSLEPPSPIDTVEPSPECVCSSVTERVPPAVIAHALANPGVYYGWRRPLNPGLPPSPTNPLRECLTLTNPNLDYRPVFNPPIWRVGCR
jgi:hypothetical protein